MQRFDDRRWQGNGTARPRRLRIDQGERAVHLSLQSSPNTQHTFVEVDVVPAQAERFALPQAKRNCDDPPRFQSVAAHGVEELAGFNEAVRLDFVLRQ